MYTRHSLCQIIYYERFPIFLYGDDNLVTSLYIQFQCSGIRFLNQVTFVEEEEEEIVVVDVRVPHSDAAEILHVK